MINVLLLNVCKVSSSIAQLQIKATARTGLFFHPDQFLLSIRARHTAHISCCFGDSFRTPFYPKGAEAKFCMAVFISFGLFLSIACFLSQIFSIFVLLRRSLLAFVFNIGSIRFLCLQAYTHSVRSL